MIVVGTFIIGDGVISLLILLFSASSMLLLRSMNKEYSCVFALIYTDDRKYGFCFSKKSKVEEFYDLFGIMEYIGKLT